jgi:hypothetical protein
MRESGLGSITIILINFRRIFHTEIYEGKGDRLLFLIHIQFFFGAMRISQHNEPRKSIKKKENKMGLSRIGDPFISSLSCGLIEFADEEWHPPIRGELQSKCCIARPGHSSICHR